MLLWIDKEMEWLASGSGQRGRAETFSDAAIQFCLMVKNLFGLALRQTCGMVASLLKLSGFEWPTPDYTTLCRRQQHLQVCIPYRPNAQGLHLLVDSTGVKMLGEGEYPWAQVENQEAWFGVSPPMAQGSFRNRCQNVGNSSR